MKPQFKQLGLFDNPQITEYKYTFSQVMTKLINAYILDELWEQHSITHSIKQTKKGILNEK